jgi:hypothetical protein
MSPEKLHTSQYVNMEIGRLPRVRSKITPKRTIPIITTMAAVGLATWSGSGVASAGPDYERQACALMDDHSTAMIMGYSSYPGQYAFVVLSQEIPPLDAAHTLLAAVHDDCPNHARDLPADWQ